MEIALSRRIDPTLTSSVVFLSLLSTSTSETCVVVLLRPTTGVLEYYWLPPSGFYVSSCDLLQLHRRYTISLFIRYIYIGAFYLRRKERREWTILQISADVITIVWELVPFIQLHLVLGGRLHPVEHVLAVRTSNDYIVFFILKAERILSPEGC